MWAACHPAVRDTAELTVVPFLPLIITTAVPFFINTLFLCTHSGHSILSSRCRGEERMENRGQEARRVYTLSSVFQAPRFVLHETAGEPNPSCLQADFYQGLHTA